MTDVLERGASAPPERPPGHHRLFALVVALALAGVAAGFAVIVLTPGEVEETNTGAATGDRAEPEDGADQSAPAASDDGAPHLVAEGDDFKAIVQSAEDYFTWLRAENPDPDLLDNVIDPRCDCYDIEKRTLVAMRRDGVRSSRTPTEVMHARVSSRPADDVAVVWTVERSDPTDLLNTDGHVLDTNPAWGPRVLLITHIRDGKGRWRAAKIEDLGPWDGVE